MPERKQIKKSSSKKSKDASNAEDISVETSVQNKSTEELKKSTDELLDEIDMLLEPMGVDVVLNYRQQGGQ